MTDKKGENFAYTGETTGHIVIEGQHVADVSPGVVIAPVDAVHARLLKKSGQFEPTTKRPTKAAEPETATVASLAATEASRAADAEAQRDAERKE